MSAMIISVSGTTVAAGGYWVDRHGHRVFAGENTLLPSCPSFPFQPTYWRLERRIFSITSPSGDRPTAA